MATADLLGPARFPLGPVSYVEHPIRTVGFDPVAHRLVEQGLRRKRGLLLYGPPGTGKTLTARYLMSGL